MPLECYCDFDFDPGQLFHEIPSDYSTFNGGRSEICSSCKDLINVGETVAEFRRGRYPDTEEEVRIYGEGSPIELASLFHCERCADLYFSLVDLGFDCVTPDEDMRDLVKEYTKRYGPGAKIGNIWDTL